MLAPRRPHASQASHGSRLQPTASKVGDKEDTGISVSCPQVKHTDVLPSVRVLASVWLYSKCPCLYSKVTLLTSASSCTYLCARYGREAEAATRGVKVKAEAQEEAATGVDDVNARPSRKPVKSRGQL